MNKKTFISNSDFAIDVITKNIRGGRNRTLPNTTDGSEKEPLALAIAATVLAVNRQWPPAVEQGNRTMAQRHHVELVEHWPRETLDLLHAVRQLHRRGWGRLRAHTVLLRGPINKLTKYKVTHECE